MKKYVFFALVFIFASCVDGMITFYVNDSTDTTIESSFPINLPINIPIPPVSTTATQEYENNKTAPNLIEEVILEKLTVTITNPSTEDFSVLKSVHIYMKKSDDSDKVEVAYLDNISSTAKSVDLICTEANLVEYLREDSYKIDTEVEVKEYLLHDVDIHIDLKFNVTAKVL
ncbi:MAG: hypothetical protein JXL97_09575 [Bacteroidales bacterium]|nr:hypothetical protein [Bacteroidales bacterium]